MWLDLLDPERFALCPSDFTNEFGIVATSLFCPDLDQTIGSAGKINVTFALVPR